MANAYCARYLSANRLKRVYDIALAPVRHYLEAEIAHLAFRTK